MGASMSSTGYEEVMMRGTTTRTGVAVVSTLMLLAALSVQPTQSAQAADQRAVGTMGSAPIAERSVMASGAAEDTLKACMARIPDIASAGQRMLAEQSCAGDEQVRKALRSAPKF
jgi:hypothetical protein